MPFYLLIYISACLHACPVTRMTLNLPVLLPGDRLERVSSEHEQRRGGVSVPEPVPLHAAPCLPRGGSANYVLQVALLLRLVFIRSVW